MNFELTNIDLAPAAVSQAYLARANLYAGTPCDFLAEYGGGVWSISPRNLRAIPRISSSVIPDPRTLPTTSAICIVSIGCKSEPDGSGIALAVLLEKLRQSSESSQQ